MKRFVNRAVTGLCLAMTAPAFAQQPASPEIQALSGKLMLEINAGLQCSVGLAGAMAKIAELQKQLAEEKAKTPNGG